MFRTKWKVSQRSNMLSKNVNMNGVLQLEMDSYCGLAVQCDLLDWAPDSPPHLLPRVPTRVVTQHLWAWSGKPHQTTEPQKAPISHYNQYVKCGVCGMNPLSTTKECKRYGVCLLNAWNYNGANSGNVNFKAMYIHWSISTFLVRCARCHQHFTVHADSYSL